jgi:ABC-type uncharacterized transport system substrate-binding protein
LFASAFLMSASVGFLFFASRIPVVFTSVGDPIGAGVVASLNRPGANVTGVSSEASVVVGKRLQIPRLRAQSIAALGEIREIKSYLQAISRKP